MRARCRLKCRSAPWGELRPRPPRWEAQQPFQPRNHHQSDSSRWRRRHSDEKFETAVAAAKDAAGQVTTATMLRAAAGIPHVHTTLGKRMAPPYIIELARSAMGGIDTDPATSEIANRTVGASLIYTIDDDGRSKNGKAGYG